MSKLLKYILLNTVVVIVTLHSVVPHPHSNELTEENHLELHKKANSLIGLIRFAFHESNDEGLDSLIYAQYGFECIKKIDTKLKCPKVSLLNSIPSNVQKREAGNPVISITTDFKRLFFVKPNGLRGPPALT